MNRTKPLRMRFSACLFCLLMLCLGGRSQAQEQLLTPIRGLPAAPDFELSDMDGVKYRLSDLRGRVVLINFWATWCPPCREEMPSMQRAWEKLQSQGVMLFGIDVGEDADTVFKFTGNYPVEFPLLLDKNGSVSEAWPVKGLPTTFIIDRDGRIAFRAIGGRAWDAPELLEIILKLQRP